MVAEVTPAELKARLDGGEPPLVVDVRDEWEVETAPFPGAVHIEMADLAEALNTLPRDREIVALCHHGGRSFTVAMMLESAGFRATNLEGGIDAWARTVDPSVPSY
ncbi:MAG: hypothetical protein LC632_06085 [Xanthomonadaceae bacterium]|nr:hypothetical protein [Xanthomonadaceae bacterium]